MVRSSAQVTGSPAADLDGPSDDQARATYGTDRERHPLAADIDTSSLIASERGASGVGGGTAIAMASRKFYPLFSKAKGDKHALNMNDIRQGSYGDCYFLAAIAAVVQISPQNIENLITPTSQSGQQGFQVRFQDTTSTFVSQNDIRAEVKSGQGAALGDDGECWVKVLEIALKRITNAIAAVNGKPVKSLMGGYASEALPLLTGRAAGDLGPAAFDGAHMQEQLHSGRLITAASNGDAASTKLSEKYGIAINNDPKTGKKNYWHEYAVSKVEQHSDGQYYATLFNPWGQGASPRPIPMSDFKLIFARITVG